MKTCKVIRRTSGATTKNDGRSDQLFSEVTISALPWHDGDMSSDFRPETAPHGKPIQRPKRKRSVDPAVIGPALD